MRRPDFDSITDWVIVAMIFAMLFDFVVLHNGGEPCGYGHGPGLVC